MTDTPILQRHRDAAAGTQEHFPQTARAIRAGRHDHTQLVQAFAASEARLLDRLGGDEVAKFAVSEFHDAIIEGKVDWQAMQSALTAIANRLKGEE